MTRPPLERRALRYRCDVEARLLREDQPPVAVKVIELSATGAFAQTDADLQVGDLATLELVLPGGPPWTVPIQVSRLGVGHEEVHPEGLEPIVVARQGAGLEFRTIPEDERRRVQEFMELLDEQ